MTSRGAVELFERQQFLIDKFNGLVRAQKYAMLYEKKMNNIFTTHVQIRFGTPITSTEVGKLCSKMYDAASEKVHRDFKARDSVIIDKAKYAEPHVKFLDVICKTFSVELKML